MAQNMLSVLKMPLCPTQKFSCLCLLDLLVAVDTIEHPISPAFHPTIRYDSRV